MGGPEWITVGDFKSETIEHADLDLRQEVEEPHAEENFEFGEVAECEGQQYEGGDEGWKSGAEGDDVASVTSGEERKHRGAHAKPGGHIPGDDGERQAETHLEFSVLCKGGQRPACAGYAREFEECGGHRKREALVVHPLLTQQHADAQVETEDGHNQGAPSEERIEPGLPGERSAWKDTLEEAFGYASIREGGPFWHVRKKELFESICG